jgi:hypothetical protein
LEGIFDVIDANVCVGNNETLLPFLLVLLTFFGCRALQEQAQARSVVLPAAFGGSVRCAFWGLLPLEFL